MDDAHIEQVKKVAAQLSPWFGVIGLVGEQGVGKTTLAEALESLGYTKVSFADQLREDVSELYGVGLHVMKGAYKNEPLEHDMLGRSPRQILQDHGAYMRRHNENHWAEQGVAKIQEGGRYVVDDVRYPNEQVMLQEKGAVIIRMTREGVGVTDDQHESEVGQRAVEADRYLQLKYNGDWSLTMTPPAKYVAQRAFDQINERK